MFDHESKREPNPVELSDSSDPSVIYDGPAQLNTEHAASEDTGSRVRFAHDRVPEMR
jgi:hypothetical protein